jgi:hypothetical protein
VSKTTVAKIKKNEHSIINAVKNSCSQNMKRKMRKTETVDSEDDILENEANITARENTVCTAEGILESIMMGRVQGTSLDDEQEVEEEEVD